MHEVLGQNFLTKFKADGVVFPAQVHHSSSVNTIWCSQPLALSNVLTRTTSVESAWILFLLHLPAEYIERQVL